MIFYFLLKLLFFGSMLVFYSLSPYFGALGLVMVALFGCMLCSLLSYSFLALVLVLIYMGGMLMVFVYSSALSAERYPKVSKLKEILVLFFFFLLWVFIGYDSLMKVSIKMDSSFMSVDLVGSSMLYKFKWFYLLVSGYMLLLALVVALMISYGVEFSVLKAL